MKYTRENIIEGINAKLDAMVAQDKRMESFYNTFRTIVFDYPIEVEQNILEWVNNEPLTEVDCHGASIKRVMENRNLPDSYFLIVLKNFIKFKNDGFHSTAICSEWL